MTQNETDIALAEFRRHCVMSRNFSYTAKCSVIRLIPALLLMKKTGSLTASQTSSRFEKGTNLQTGLLR
jgi:hypothetical protein